ncbi:MAG: hypothetical protein OXG42_06615 [Chloroflexi bacterium]|nr:hypothetical protein [Chloroflexota bacterium]
MADVLSVNVRLIRETLETMRATAARVGALEVAPGPALETAGALACEATALTLAIEGAQCLRRHRKSPPGKRW